MTKYILLLCRDEQIEVISTADTLEDARQKMKDHMAINAGFSSLKEMKAAGEDPSFVKYFEKQIDNGWGVVVDDDSDMPWVYDIVSVDI